MEKSPESKSAQGHESPNTVLGKAVTIFMPVDAFMFLPSTWTLHCTLFFFFKLFLFVFVFRPRHTGYSPGIARVGHDLVTKPPPPHSLWDLSSLIRDPEIKPTPSTVNAQSLNHWTTREYPGMLLFLNFLGN